MKKTISLCLACVMLAAACVFSASCAQVGLTLPSNITTQPAGQTSGTSLSATTEITTSAKPSAVTTQATTNAPTTPPDLSKVAKINYLDFRPKMNKWAEKDADGNYKYTSFKGSDYVDENGNPGGDHYPFALYNDSVKGVNYEFTNDGETLKLTSTDVTNPGIAFEFSLFNTYFIGPEEKEGAEYVKIRFKNHSSATKLTFMGCYYGRLDARSTATIDIEPNSDEWQTITLSMVEGTKNSANNSSKNNTWNSYLKKFAIYPFGYNKDCEATVGAEMEIDYVVIGSSEYVNSYKSALEKAAS